MDKEDTPSSVEEYQRSCPLPPLVITTLLNNLSTVDTLVVALLDMLIPLLPMVNLRMANNLSTVVDGVADFKG